MIIKRDFIYTPKGTSRPLHIYLPDNYFESEKRYPVMYFFDGHNLFFNEDATYGKSWGLKEFLDNWEKEIIVVGIEPAVALAAEKFPGGHVGVMATPGTLKGSRFLKRKAHNA